MSTKIGIFNIIKVGNLYEIKHKDETFGFVSTIPEALDRCNELMRVYHIGFFEGMKIK